MDTIIRVKQIKIENLKNIQQGVLSTITDFSSMDIANIVGIYGQNGSGKTTIVEAFSLLKHLLSSNTLPQKSEYLIQDGQKSINITFDFLIQNEIGTFESTYACTLEQDKNNLFVTNEMLSFRENLPYHKVKILIQKEDDTIKIRNTDLQDIPEKERIQIMIANKMALAQHTSFIFDKNLNEVLSNELNTTEIKIIKNLKEDFNNSFHIIKDTQTGLILTNILMPFHIALENSKQNMLFMLKESMVASESDFEIINKAIDQINIVLKTLVPNLSIEASKITEETNTDGEKGIRFEFLSMKENTKLPLRCESAGVLKLISILSSLIAVNNNPNACVVIDELDSGVFEYLLGEILQVINDNGKGQLFFTSHNLRLLEVLDSNQMWFSTTNNKDRFIQLKGVKKLSNVRDMYLRAVQLGGQKEELYDETDDYAIRKAFLKAGTFND